MLPFLPNPGLEANNIVWTTPSVDAAGSMPIGNGEVVCNVWVEAATGDLMILIGRTDSLSEISRVLKLGRVRIHFSPSPRGEGEFRQSLDLRSGTLSVEQGGDRLRVFVDPAYDVVHVAGRFRKGRQVRATLETWRDQPRPLPINEGSSAWSAQGAPVPLVESADVVKSENLGVTWYHRNETSIVPELWKEQSLTGLSGTFDPLLHRTFGGRITGEGFRYKGDTAISRTSTKTLDLAIATDCVQGSVDRWRSGVHRNMKASPLVAAERRNQAWWSGFWQRSWIDVGGTSEDALLINRGYALQRYAFAIQSRGQYPVKFNGGYFTVEPTVMGRKSNPDWRNWGDAHWFQNCRFTVAPDLASGDTDLMESYFRLYERSRPLCESRSKHYYGATGAYFPETMSVYGTYAGNDYGWNREGKQPGDVDCEWWRWAWNQGPELLKTMLDYYDYTGDRRFLKDRLVPMADSVMRYFDTRFKKDSSGKIILDPTQVVETYWKGVVNDTPTVATLQAVAPRLASLPELSKSQRDFFVHMHKSIPPLTIKDGKIEMAEKYVNEITNVENPALYAAYPARVASLANPKLLKEARAAYAAKLNNLDHGWGYDGAAAALLGLQDEAVRVLRNQVRNSNSNFRWPATWGPNFDWVPDQNHGGNLMITAQLMLLQAEPLSSGGAIRVLPTWPKEWDVDFRLHAPGNTVVHCVQKGGKVVTLEVTPASRRKDVILPGD